MKWTNTKRVDLVNRVLNGETFESVGRDYSIGGDRARQVFLSSLRKANNIYKHFTHSGMEPLEIRDIRTLRALRDMISSYVEHALLNSKMEKPWHQSVPTLTVNALKAEFGPEIVRDKDKCKEALLCENVRKIPYLGRKGIGCLELALGVKLIDD